MNGKMGIAVAAADNIEEELRKELHCQPSEITAQRRSPRGIVRSPERNDGEVQPLAKRRASSAAVKTSRKNGHNIFTGEMIGSDPPSGSELYCGKKVPVNQLQYDSYPTRPEEEPIEKPGRTMTKLSPVVHEYERRPWLQVCPAGSSFDLSRAESDISGALRLHYRGDAVWKDVCIATRKSLWKEFGMRYRWRPEHEHGVMDMWEKRSQTKFRIMMNHTKNTYLEGLRQDIPKIWRTEWMEPIYFYICRKRWDSTKEVQKCRQKAQNRGVVFGENGIPLRRAPPTRPVSKRMTDHATQMESGSSRNTSLNGVSIPRKQPIQSLSELPQVFHQTHAVNKEEAVALEEVNVEASVEMVEEDGSPIVIPKVEERWTEEPAHNLTMDHTETTPQLARTSECGNILEPSLGPQCAGDVTHDRMRRISPELVLEEAGFTSQQGCVSPPLSQVTNRAEADLLNIAREIKEMRREADLVNVSREVKEMKREADLVNIAREVKEMRREIKTLIKSQKAMMKTTKQVIQWMCSMAKQAKTQKDEPGLLFPDDVGWGEEDGEESGDESDGGHCSGAVISGSS